MLVPWELFSVSTPLSVYLKEIGATRKCNVLLAMTNKVAVRSFK